MSRPHVRANAQAEQILAELRRRNNEGLGGLTPREAQELFGCMRLAARVHELKRDGHNIQKRMVATPGGATVASYYLA